MFSSEPYSGTGASKTALTLLSSLAADLPAGRTNGAAAEVMSVDRLGEKGTPWHFWEDKSRLTGVAKKPLCQKT